MTIFVNVRIDFFNFIDDNLLPMKETNRPTNVDSKTQEKPFKKTC